MTTIDTPDVPPDSAPLSIPEFLATVRDKAQEVGPHGEKVPVAVGTFAIYPMEDGGIMVVMAVNAGPMSGTHHHRVSPRMIQALAALGPGGGKLKALKGIFGGAS